jgi:hypothetical protein
MTDKILFTTVHGSHLYGLAHAGSDRDSMVVYADSRKARHKKSGEDDRIHVGVYDLLEKAADGSHQFVEGLFSQKKVWHDESFRPLLEATRIPGAWVRPKFERTIKKFCFDDFKFRRHAVRLHFLLRDLTDTGVADPTLSPIRVAYANYLAERYEDRELFNILVS